MQNQYTTTIPGASHWSFRIRHGMQLRLTDIEGNANVGMLFYNPENLLERYNAPDTLKAQHTFKLTKGHCLYSDMGRVFCSIIEDSVGWHETVCGNSTKTSINQRFGEKTYQQAHNEWNQNGYDAFLVELAKYGLGKKDMAANLNLFSKSQVDHNGDLSYVKNNSSAGDHILLRFEMDTLVLMHTCPHPLYPDGEYPRKSVQVSLEHADPVEKDDLCMNHCAENQRGFENNRLYLLGLGI
ncbi:MAG: urea carboxylase-associated family protein [Gammaproteobacteria bacterium]|nr:urea carboxylase-associated family protein [Gammaproteobacteria bacterium]